MDGQRRHRRSPLSIPVEQLSPRKTRLYIELEVARAQLELSRARAAAELDAAFGVYEELRAAALDVAESARTSQQKQLLEQFKHLVAVKDEELPNELSEAIDPFQAGLGFAVQLKNRDFIGATALKALKSRPDQPRRIGLELFGKRVPREHYPVLANGVAVGEITSGTFSPTLERPIAMAYVQPHAAESGTELTVDIRGRAEAARVVPLPFYKRESD